MNFKFKIGTIWDTFSNADALSKLAEENLSLKSDCPKIFALKGKDLHLGIGGSSALGVDDGVPGDADLARAGHSVAGMARCAADVG